MHNMREMKNAAEISVDHLFWSVHELMASAFKQENYNSDFGIFLGEKIHEIIKIRDEIKNRLEEGAY